jgi:tight adherence protein C
MLDFTLTASLAAAFVAVGLFTWSIGSAILERSSPTRRRLNALVPGGDEIGLFAASGLAGTLPPRQSSTLVPLSLKNQGRTRRRLTEAGFHRPSAVNVFTATQLVSTIVLAALPLLVMGRSRGFMIAVFGGVLGYMAPGLLLDRRVSQRRLRIENGLPDALDLLIVSIEAGLALDQAILKTGEELALAHPELAEELRLINIECRAGKPRIEAFKNFAARTKVDDVRSLVAMLVQTDRFGTSVAKALRTHAEVSRTKRRQRAEERAAKIGVKLVFPLVFCLFPAFYVVTLGPAIIKFIQAFGSGGFATGGR